MPKPKPRFRRWTGDTEVAFLMALRLTGSVTRACAEIGRSAHGAGDRRRRLPEFAAKWQEVLDEWQAEQAAERQAARRAEGARAMPNRARYDGFTPLRQRAFLRSLTETGKYEEACRQVGVSPVAARVMRRRYPAFQAACDRALARSPGVLAQVAFERAVDGVEEEVWHAGRIVGTRRRFSEPLMRQLIGNQSRKERDETAVDARAKAAKRAAKRAERLAAARGGKRDPSIKHVSMEEVEAALLKNLDGLARGLRRDAAAQVAAFQASWGAFGRAAVARMPEQEVLPPLGEGDAGPVVRLE